MSKLLGIPYLKDGYYIVQKNDTLSHIAQRLTGSANNYHTIAAANGLANADKIKEGQKLIIPKKFNKPLKRSEIPTKNKVQVIDNYSPSYNYIVEEDKIYYSKKGNDHWVDISDNEKARQNLYNFIGNKYNFRGYQDNEKNIWGKIKEGTFNYSHYRDSVNNTVISEPAKKVAKKVEKKTEKRKEIVFPKVSEKSHIEKRDAISTPSIYTQEQKFTPFGVDELLKKLSEGSSKKPSNKNDDYNPDDYFNIPQLWEKGKNWIGRQWGKLFDTDENVSKLDLPYPENKDSKYAIRPGSYTGDTIRLFNDRRYILPESIDVSEYTFGYRNRGQVQPLDTEGGVVTSFTNFLPYGKHVKGRDTYIGIDANGKLIAGSIDSFGEGSYLAPTFSNEVTQFITNEDGSIHYSPSKKNPGKMQPAAEIIDPKTGQIIHNPESQAINLLANKGDKKGTYGNITGGRYLVRVGNEMRLLSGSVENIRDEFEAMKNRNNANSGTFYTLDNGSFNIGLRTIDKKLTTADLKHYDQRNAGGGNFLYLKEKLVPRDVYKSDTLWTPNIRTVNDESYKKGHGLTNELQGVVLHHTAFMEPDLTNVVNYLRNPKNQASSHVVIGYDGTRKVLANPTDVTFHAGASVWNNRDNVNDFMLGIEFQGDTNRKDLTEDQIKSAVEYLKPIIKKHNISLENITTHEQVRALYNDFALKQGKKPVAAKHDINQRNYERILNELLKQVYYVK